MCAYATFDRSWPEGVDGDRDAVRAYLEPHSVPGARTHLTHQRLGHGAHDATGLRTATKTRQETDWSLWLHG